jgi:hypothetical protein
MEGGGLYQGKKEFEVIKGEHWTVHHFGGLLKYNLIFIHEN